MNIAAHHVAPEELMAFLDGELSAAELQAVSGHVDQCVECAKVAEQLRRPSQALSVWKVPAIPEKVEKAVTEVAVRKEPGLDIGKPDFFIRASFWNWKRYAIVSVGAMSALMILVMIGTPNLLRVRPVMRGDSSSYIPIARQAEDKIETRGSIGKLQTDAGVVGALVGGQPASQDVLPEPNEPPPMIARTVSLSIIVRDFAVSRSALDTILARYHGYSARLNASTRENAPRSLQASLRIPAPALSAAVGDLKRLGRVENESQSGEEVTRQHADLIARLKNARDTEQRLREILQQRTGKIGEVLRVEQEIARVRGEIESMEADQKALERRVDFATVELQLTEEYKAQLNPPAPSISTRIHNAFVAGYQNASETVLGILLFFAEYGPALLIWLAILGLPVIMVWRRYRRISSTV